MSKPDTFWNTERVARMRSLRARKPPATWEEIGALFNRNPASCCSVFNYRMNSTERNERSKQRRARRKQILSPGRYPANSIYKGTGPLLDDVQIQEQARRLNGYEARDLTAAAFGDPPRGFSALDQRQGART